MSKVIKISCLFSLSLLLSGWSFTTPLEWFYFNRAKFSLLTEDGESRNIFLCIKGKTESETEKRANEANTYYAEGADKIVKRFTDKMLKELLEDGDKDDDNSKKNAFILSQIGDTFSLQKEIAALVVKTENLYQCKLIDIRDIKPSDD